MSGSGLRLSGDFSVRLSSTQAIRMATSCIPIIWSHGVGWNKRWRRQGEPRNSIRSR